MIIFIIIINYINTMMILKSYNKYSCWLETDNTLEWGAGQQQKIAACLKCLLLLPSPQSSLSGSWQYSIQLSEVHISLQSENGFLEVKDKYIVYKILCAELFFSFENYCEYSSNSLSYFKLYFLRMGEEPCLSFLYGFIIPGGREFFFPDDTPPPIPKSHDEGGSTALPPGPPCPKVGSPPPQ